MSKPTLTLDDVPVAQLGVVAKTLRAQAEQIAQHARERLAANDHTGAVARYEAALARFQDAQLVDEYATVMVSQVSKAHSERAGGGPAEHVWPLPHLENITHVHREPGPNMGRSWDETFPRWGIQVDTRRPEVIGYVSITPAADYPRDQRGGVILRVTEGRADRPASTEPETDVTVYISGDEWRALNALAERIGDREPVPYDEDGRTLVRPVAPQ